MPCPASRRHAARTRRLALAIAACLGATAVHAADEAPPPDAVTLDRVVVTAEKQGRSQHDTATSTTVLDDRSLQARGLDGSRDVMDGLVNVTSVGTGNFAPAVRGVDGTGASQGVDAFFAGSRPRLNVAIDGRPASYNEIVFGNNSMWDVQQVELLRGPQSLLQGRNAIAGTLAIKTKDPTFEPEGSARVLAGSQDRRQAAFALSGPLGGDQFAFRLAGDWQRRESDLDFEDFPGASDIGRFETRTLRGKLLFQPAALPDFEALLTFQHAQARAPQTEQVMRPFADRVPSTTQMPVFAPRTNATVLDTTWQLDDRLRWENLAAATDLHVDRFAPVGTGIARIDNREYVLEPRLVLERGDSRLGGIAGVYLFRANQEEFLDFPADEYFDDRVRTAAAYAEGTIALREDLDLTLGARYERETHRRHGGEGALVAIDIDKAYSAFLPKVGLAWRPDAAWTLGVLASRGYNAGGGGITFEFPIVSYSYDAEFVNNYEAYFRGDLADGRVQLTGNVFYGDYRDMQLPFDLNPDPAVWSVVVRNADRARNYGAELGLRWLAAAGLELHAELGALKTEVTRYPDSGIEGREFANAPSLTATLGAGWQSAGGLELGLDARHSNAYWSDIENRPLGRTEPYWMLDAKGGYHVGDVYLFAGVTNLLDEDTPVSIATNGPDPTEFDTAVLPQPRGWYAGVQVDW